MPVFSELLEHKRRREAVQLATALAGLILLALTVLTLLFILVAPYLMPLFTGDESRPRSTTSPSACRGCCSRSSSCSG